MNSLRCLALLLLALVPAGASPAHGSTFTAGDLYLITGSHPDPEISIGILRIVPETGEVTSLGAVPMTPRYLCYDPYRDRLIGDSTTPTSGLMLVDVTGATTPFAGTLPTPAFVEPRGDGILYLFFENTGNLGYLDATDTYHDLLDESGTAQFSLGGDADPSELQYDYDTNSLLLFGGTDTDMPGCPDQTRSCALKIPLTAAGTQVAGTVTTTQAEVSSTWEIVVGASPVPGAGVLWVLDTNSNDQEPRMQILDPATMVNTAYASNGAYTGAAQTNAGAFSERLGLAVILDTFNDVLRAFGYGGTGNGTVIAEDVSTEGGSGETARLVEIRPSPFAGVAEGNAPVRGALLSAYPNPFQPRTTIRFDVPAQGRVRLEVYDVAGRLVRTLLDADLPQGRHQAVWNGTDELGRQAAPGVYHCKLRVGEDVHSLKLVRLD